MSNRSFNNLKHRFKQSVSSKARGIHIAVSFMDNGSIVSLRFAIAGRKSCVYLNIINFEIEDNYAGHILKRCRSRPCYKSKDTD